MRIFKKCDSCQMRICIYILFFTDKCGGSVEIKTFSRYESKLLKGNNLSPVISLPFKSNFFLSPTPVIYACTQNCHVHVS